MPKYNVNFKAYAKDDTKKHIRFLANVSIPASRKLHKEFDAIVLKLSETPLQNPIFYKNYRKEIIAVRYILLYEVVGQNVYIDKILDARSKEYNNIVLELD